MLKQITIKNFLLIHESEIEFGKGLNIITGETGSGKSLVLDALELCLGARADYNIISPNADKCVIEALFSIKKEIQDLLIAEGLDAADELILRRELTKAGKSRAFINDTPIALNFLKTLATSLLDLNRQNESLELKSALAKLEILDAFSGLQSERELLKLLATKCTISDKEIAKLETEKIRLEKEKDYLSFLNQEFEELSIANKAEREELETEFKKLNTASSSVEDIQLLLQLMDEQNGLSDVYKQINQLVKRLNKSELVSETLFENVNEVSEKINALSFEFNQLANYLQFDPKELEKIKSRISEFYRLEKKHNVIGTEALLQTQLEVKQKLESIGTVSQDLEKAKENRAVEFAEFEKFATKISQIRQKNAKVLSAKVGELLPSLGMKSAEFVVSLNQKSNPSFDYYALDEIDFIFSANKGIALRPIELSASGGELSRISLVLKTLTAGSLKLPTLIFDEIDTGISGEVGIKTAKLLEEIAQNHQTIVISHLPQVAARGSHHIDIQKSEKNGKTIIQTKVLNRDEKLVVIAKMIAGESAGTSAFESATLMMQA